jgi:anti-sigma regulatory factor (Ser/Thr protein kinase)
MRLPCNSSAPRRVRQAMEGLDAIRPVRDDALLIASELTTNAVIHSSAARDEELELLAELVPDGVRIAVVDACREEPLSGPRPAGEPEPERLGLRIVQAIARRWGTERLNGRRLWAVLAM